MFVCYRCMHDRYGFWNFFWDFWLLCFTCGFWFIGIWVREYRRRTRRLESMYWRNACCGF